MKDDIRRMIAAMAIPFFLIFILYLVKILEAGMEWDFTHLGVFPLQRKGLFGIFAHPLVHSSFHHLMANTIPLFFLMWCLFYFYRNIAPFIFLILWIGCGMFTFAIGKAGWHVGSSGVIYGLAFFLFFSGFIRKHIPLIAISLLITFVYGGLVWNMFPFFAKETTSWEGHLSGAITGALSAFIFRKYGPQRPVVYDKEEEDPEKEDGAEKEDKIDKEDGAENEDGRSGR